MEVENAISNIKNIKLFMEIENDKNPDCQFSQDNIDALSEAVKALEKEIPKEPVEEYIFRGAFREHLKKHAPDMADSTDYKCPVCGRRIRIGKENNSYGRRDNFCQRCGQAINWSEEE